MNKYASGYSLLQALSVVGWLVLGASVIGGFVVGANAPRDMGWFGFVVAIAGGFQGLLLIGIASIGGAVLDGSLAQQRSASLLVSISEAFGGKTVLELNTVEQESNLQEPISAAKATLSDANTDEGVQIELNGAGGKALSAFRMNDGRLKVRKGGGWMVFESKEEAEEYYRKRP